VKPTIKNRENAESLANFKNSQAERLLQRKSAKAKLGKLFILKVYTIVTKFNIKTGTIDLSSSSHNVPYMDLPASVLIFIFTNALRVFPFSLILCGNKDRFG